MPLRCFEDLRFRSKENSSGKNFIKGVFGNPVDTSNPRFGNFDLRFVAEL